MGCLWWTRKQHGLPLVDAEAAAAKQLRRLQAEAAFDAGGSGGTRLGETIIQLWRLG